jgi:acetyl-CoA C-acetyltransferase
VPPSHVDRPAWPVHGATAPNRFGQFATAHREAYGTERRHLARIAEKSHHHGSLNPHSYFQNEVSCDPALAAPIVSWPLGLLDCGPTTDDAPSRQLSEW